MALHPLGNYRTDANLRVLYDVRRTIFGVFPEWRQQQSIRVWYVYLCSGVDLLADDFQGMVVDMGGVSMDTADTAEVWGWVSHLLGVLQAGCYSVI